MNFNRKPPIFRFFFALVVFGIGCFGISDSMAQAKADTAATVIAINPEEATPFNLTATVMEVNKKQPCHVVVAEKIILVTPYKLGKEVYETRLTNQFGSTITLDRFKHKDRVIVEGWKLKDGTFVGTHIQIKPKKK